jgi:kynurenine formamidase
MLFVKMLTNLDRLPARGASFVFLPLKIALASGGPGRALALVPDAS